MISRDKQENMTTVYEHSNIKKKKYDEKIASIISVILVSIFIINLHSGLESILRVPHSYVSLIGKYVIALFFLINGMTIIKRINVKIVLLILFTVFIAGLNLLFFSDNLKAFINILFTFLTMCLPIMICIYAIRDMEILYRKLKQTSYVIGVIVFLSMIIFNLFGFAFNNNEYSMGFGASIMLSTCFLIIDALNNKFLAFILSSTNILAIMLYGSRGPLLSIGLWVFLYLYQSVSSKDVNKKIKVRFKILFLIGTLTFIFLYFDGFKLIYQFLEAKGIYSRTLYLFANNFGHLSNRDLLYNYFWDSIKDSPFSIRGIGADRVAYGAYPHNIIIELLFQLGILLSAPLLIALFIMSWKSIFNNKITSYNLLITIFFCVGMALRLISGSLWEDMYFWGWIALYTKYNKKHYLK